MARRVKWSKLQREYPRTLQSVRDAEPANAAVRTAARPRSTRGGRGPADFLAVAGARATAVGCAEPARADAGAFRPGAGRSANRRAIPGGNATATDRCVCEYHARDARLH